MAGMGVGREKDFACCDPTEEVTPLFEGLKASAMGSGRNEVMMMDAAVAQTPKSTSATESNCLALSQNVDDLFNAVERIEHRLSDILMSSPESSGPAEKRGYPRESALSDRLATLAERVDDITYRLNRLTGLIDL